MSLENEVILRPRFKIELSQNNKNALETFEDTKDSQDDFIVSRVDNHVFIRIPKKRDHFWSPQLHLEIDEIDDNSSEVRGLFGPKSTVWTMFMFFHFAVVGLFIGFGVWAYSNWSLKTSYGLQVGLMLSMVVMWFVLYIAGRMGKIKGRDEMKELCGFLEDTLDLKETKEKEDCI